MTAFVILAVGGVIATLGGFVAVEVAGRVHHHPLPGWPDVLLGSAERLVGVEWVAFPPTIDRYASISLLAVGISLIVVALYLLTRPVVDRRLSSGRAADGPRAAELRARDIVRRHGTGTLDYFALRDDKQWFFHRDSLVAYAVFGGVCLVSPDPIGPFSERAHVWDSFRRYVDRNGWGLGVMGAGEEWLPTYQASGMRFLYIGDEAVVDPREFSLQGGKMKGLRQAVNRVARYGYTVRFFDPARLDPADAARMAELMAKSRRGEQERGFSMMLGRLFDPRDTGLLLTLVEGPDGAPVAMCQFVPSPAIGGYSLDLMRRDPGDHPNGLLDFALCSTIEPSQGDGHEGPQPELRRPALRARGRQRRRRHAARGALGPAPALGRAADRDAVAFQRQVRAAVAAPLHRLRLGRAVRARRRADHAGRIADRGAGHRPPAHHRRGQALGARRARRGARRAGARRATAAAPPGKRPGRRPRP